MASPETRRQRRVVTACLACRTKKIKCDGQMPTCERCVLARTPCVYDFKSDRRKPPSRSYVDSLLLHIANLERRLQVQHAGPALDNAADAPSSSGGPHSAAGENELSSGYVDSVTRLYGSMEPAEDGQLRYFGAPSFFNLKKRPQYDPPATDPSDDIYEEYGRLDPGMPDDLRDHLLQLFWTWQNPWQYMVHKSAFCEAIANNTYSSYCTPLLLLSVLALASRYSDRPELRAAPDDCESAGDALADQAKAILHFEMEKPSVSTVVSLLLLSLREMSVNKEALGWCYVGLAIRLAFNLGLNQDCSRWVEEGRITMTEAEINKTAFWACYMLDKLFVIGLGRPGMIQQRDITVSKSSITLLEECERWQHNGVYMAASHAVTNMNQTCSMFEVACEALEEIYAPNSRLSLTEKEAKAQEAYAKLEQLHNSLPSFMKLASSIKAARAAHVYSFHLQYCCVVILLHRPFLDRRWADQQHYHVCMQAARRVTSIMRAYRSHYSLRHMPISTAHCVGTASVILLLGATSQDPTLSKISSKMLKFNVQCLDEMSEAWMWSLRTMHCLQILAKEWGVSGIMRTEDTSIRDDESEAPGRDVTSMELDEASANAEAVQVQSDDLMLEEAISAAAVNDQLSGGQAQDWSDTDWCFNLYDWAGAADNMGWFMTDTI